MSHLRLFLALLLFVSFFFLPWWALFLLLLPGLALFPFYGEALALGLALDLVYREPALGVTPLWATLGALGLIVLSRLLKRGLRFARLTPYAEHLF